MAIPARHFLTCYCLALGRAALSWGRISLSGVCVPGSGISSTYFVRAIGRAGRFGCEVWMAPEGGLVSKVLV